MEVEALRTWWSIGRPNWQNRHVSRVEIAFLRRTAAGLTMACEFSGAHTTQPSETELISLVRLGGIPNPGSQQSSSIEIPSTLSHPSESMFQSMPNGGCGSRVLR